MYKVEIIARYIVNKCIREHHPITNLQLQKILYGLAEEYRKKNSELFMKNSPLKLNPQKGRPSTTLETLLATE